MFKWSTLVLGQLATNCYLVWDEDSKECMIIDPADDGVFISQELEARQLVAKGVLLTHGHFDHQQGALDLKLIYKIPVYASKKDDFLLKKATKSASFWLKQDLKTPPLPVDNDLDKIDYIALGKGKIVVIITPGHTPGGVCFYLAEERVVFTGDTLFFQLRGRTDFKYSSTTDIFESLEKLFCLPAETRVLSGHGEETTIGAEKKYRSFEKR